MDTVTGQWQVDAEARMDLRENPEFESVGFVNRIGRIGMENMKSVCNSRGLNCL